MPQRKFSLRKYRLLEVLLVGVLLLLFAGTAVALHEIDHRYEVRGYVLDSRDHAIKGVPVTVSLNDEVIGSSRTDSEGHYAIRVHLHDSDIGRLLTVRAGTNQAEIRMEATRGDASTPRIHHLNFVAGKPREKKLAGQGVPLWAYVAGAPILIWGAVYATGLTRRQLRHVKKAASAAGAGRTRKRKRKGNR